MFGIFVWRSFEVNGIGCVGLVEKQIKIDSYRLCEFIYYDKDGPFWIKEIISSRSIEIG